MALNEGDGVRQELVPTGVLRAAINLGNPVLSSGTPGEPRGVTVAIARELGRRLGVPVELVCVGVARESFAAVVTGRVDVAFLAIEPRREDQLAFSRPYVEIEGVYVVPEGSAYGTPGDLDRHGVRIGVREGAAYDLFLSRTLQRAELVRGADSLAAFDEHELDALAGVRQPMAALVAGSPGHRLVEPAFMRIRQAVGVARGRPRAHAYLTEVVSELVTSGFVRAELARSGQDPDLASS